MCNSFTEEKCANPFVYLLKKVFFKKAYNQITIVQQKLNFWGIYIEYRESNAKSVRCVYMHVHTSPEMRVKILLLGVAIKHMVCLRFL